MTNVNPVTVELLERIVEHLQDYIDADVAIDGIELCDSIASLLELAAHLPAIRNMVDFATWHAVDGMSPAMDDDELLENATDDVEANALYVKQRTKVDRVRNILGLPEETGWVVKK